MYFVGQPINEIKNITEYVFFLFTGASVVNDTSSLFFVVFTRLIHEYYVTYYNIYLSS